MRRFASLLACLLLAHVAAPAQAQAQAQTPAQAPAPTRQPPHAWLFGTWSGGIFPAPSNLSAEACLSQPVVIFTRDLVLRATLVEQALTQREIETVRTTPTGFEFRFIGAAPGFGGLLGVAAPTQAAGFGCIDPNQLTVQRRGENELSFPGCDDFPNPLVRCPTR